MVNTLGDDDHGTAYLEKLRSEGIDTTFMRRVPGSSGVAPIWVDAHGTNRIIVVPGANDAGAPRRRRRGRGGDPTRGRRRPIRDPAGDDGSRVRGRPSDRRRHRAQPGAGGGCGPGTARGHRLARPERARVRAHRRRAPRRRRADRGRPVAAFGGARGVVSRDARRARRRRARAAAPRPWVPALLVDAIDTTGAGDAFVGAFAVGLANGWRPSRQPGSAARPQRTASPGMGRRPRTPRARPRRRSWPLRGADDGGPRIVEQDAQPRPSRGDGRTVPTAPSTTGSRSRAAGPGGGS